MIDLTFGVRQPGVVETLGYPTEETRHLLRPRDNGCHSYSPIRALKAEAYVWRHKSATLNARVRSGQPERLGRLHVGCTTRDPKIAAGQIEGPQFSARAGSTSPLANSVGEALPSQKMMLTSVHDAPPSQEEFRQRNHMIALPTKM